MEKLRVFLEWLRKYHFWVLCGLTVLLAMVSWFCATGDEEDQFAKRTGAIKSKFGLVRDVLNKSDHPTQKSIQSIQQQERGPLSDEVAAAWGRLYSEMRQSNRLPVLYTTEAPQTEFEARFNAIWGPMERIAKQTDQQLGLTYREQFRYHIHQHVPKLSELIERRTKDQDASKAAAEARPQGILGGKDADENPKAAKGVLDWDDADQKSKSFLDRYTGNTPSTLDIMLAQEELWVYEALLRVIRYTNNTGPDRSAYADLCREQGKQPDPNAMVAYLEANYKKPASHKFARIKKIVAMDIGKDAVQSWSKCERSLFNPQGDASGAGAGSNTGASKGSGGSASGAAALEGRYVDDKGNRLADAAQQPFPEFRMMPVNLKVVIEQTEIPRFLAECANSAMRIDVRKVRILVQDPGPVNLAGSSESKALKPPEKSSKEGSHDEESADPTCPPVTVEVQGIIYIYNPPTQSAGSKEGAAGGGSQAAPAVPAGGAPAVPPAGPVPPKPPPGAPATGVPAIGPTGTGAAAPAAPAASPSQPPASSAPAAAPPGPRAVPAVTPAGPGPGRAPAAPPAAAPSSGVRP